MVFTWGIYRSDRGPHRPSGLKSTCPFRWKPNDFHWKCLLLLWPWQKSNWSNKFKPDSPPKKSRTLADSDVRCYPTKAESILSPKSWDKLMDQCLLGRKDECPPSLMLWKHRWTYQLRDERKDLTPMLKLTIGCTGRPLHVSSLGTRGVWAL